MKNTRRIPQCITLLVITTLFHLISCAATTPRQWRQLSDKTFYFDQFIYSKGYMKKHKALEFMKNTGTEKIFTALETSFGITVNRDSYKSFIDAGIPKTISTKGFPVKDTYTWQVTSPNGNSIRLIREEEVGYEGMPDYSCELQVISKDRILIRFSETEEESYEVIPQLLLNIRAQKISEKNLST